MTALNDVHRLTWVMTLTAEGYTCWTLTDDDATRWGWIINAGEIGWTAHTGSWDATPLLAVPEECHHHNLLSGAKGWVEEAVAIAWRRYVERQRSEQLRDQPHD